MTWVMAPAPALYVLAGAALLQRKTALPAPDLSGTAKDALFFGFIAAGSACVLVAAFAARRLRRRAPGASLSAAAQHFVQTHVVTLALAEAPAALGLAYFLLTRDLARMIVLAAYGSLALFFFLPRRATLDALVRRDGNAGDASPS
jgi:hypothetical protein